MSSDVRKKDTMVVHTISVLRNPVAYSRSGDPGREMSGVRSPGDWERVIVCGKKELGRRGYRSRAGICAC